MSRKENIDTVLIGCRYWSVCKHGMTCLQNSSYKVGEDRFFPDIGLGCPDGKEYQINCNDFEEVK